MTLHDIRWNLALADGLQFVTLWWNHFYERCSNGGVIYHGAECVRRGGGEAGEVIV